MNYAGVAMLCMFAAITLVAVAAAVLRGSGLRGTSGGGDEGGGGGGGTVRRKPSPPDRPPSSDQPSRWPGFEREFERWAPERRTRRGPLEPLRN